MSETCIRKAELAPSLHTPGFSEACLPCVLLCYHTLHSRVSLCYQFGQNSDSTNDISSFIMLGKKSYYYPASISPTCLENFLLRTVRNMGSLPVSFSARQRHTTVYKTIESRASQLRAQGNGGGCWGAKPVLLQDRVLEPLPPWLH